MDKCKRICLYCENLEVEHSCMGSEWTGRYGEDGFSCKKGHFSEYDEGAPDTLEEMRKLFEKAATCNDYDQPLDQHNKE